MVTLSAFKRVIVSGGREVPVELDAWQVLWLDAQEHQGRNLRDSYPNLHRPQGTATDPAPQEVRRHSDQTWAGYSFGSSRRWATYGKDWLPGVHEWQLQRLARRSERDG